MSKNSLNAMQVFPIWKECQQGDSLLQVTGIIELRKGV